MLKTASCRTVKYAIVLWGVLFSGLERCPAATIASRDGRVDIDNQNQSIVIQTNTIEEKIGASNGHYLLRSFRNRQTLQEYLSKDSVSSEFRTTLNGNIVDGGSEDWRWVYAKAVILNQGEIEATVTLQGNLLEVEKHYCVYPGTSIVRQWVVFKNRSSSPIEIEDPYFLNVRLLTAPTPSQTLYYMTGGGNFTGSQILRQVAITQSYSRSFDTTDKPEFQKVEGLENGGASSYGSGSYMGWFAIGSTEWKDGVFIGLDYYGRWVAEIGRFQDSPGYLGLRMGGYKKSLQPGESMETPKAFTGIWSGDLDEMGNELKNWQYAYLWDYTNNDYFGKIRFTSEMRMQPEKGGAWGGGTEDNWDFRMASVFHTADVIRYVGADILWQDAGWHDNLGDNDGPDFKMIQQYIGKSGVRLTVWWPLWYVDKQSKVHREHPDWGAGGIFEVPLNVGRPEVVQWMANQLDQKVAEWGDFQWREDGSAVGPVGSTTYGDYNPAVDETPLLDQYNNIMEMQKDFRKHHPNSSIDLCSSGGGLMSFEGLRLADVGQLTDGGSLAYGNYYSSYLFPPDKIDDWTRTQNATAVNIATTLTMAPAWLSDRGIYNHEPGILLDGGKEKLRKEFEIYHYLFREGVAGRWVQVYHPKVESDDPIYYFQRMSRDRHHGVIVLKHFPEGQVRIYPKGLIRDEIYDVSFEVSKSKFKRSGLDLQRNGIVLFNPEPLELIYLGLPNHPGSGTDSIPPTAPDNVTKRLGTNVGVTGVELHWSAATDNNWLSYYQIYRDGKPIDRVSTGLFYFDHSLDANIFSVYRVQAVDGDSNSSAMVEASKTGMDTEVYTAWGGYLSGKDYSYQGANNWTYERWDGTDRNLAIWNGALGQQGLYQGPSDEHKLLIGATWMRPSNDEDAVRVFTMPRSGRVTVTGNVHKDLYHLSGDGVRVKIMKGKEQIWPDDGWVAIPASDINGTDMNLSFDANAGDQLFFVVNHNGDSIDDETVWNPEVSYSTPLNTDRLPQRTVLDDVDHDIGYVGSGWQTEGVPPWADSNTIGGDIGYLNGRYKGTLSVSGTAGDRMKVTFRGTGIYIIGDTGSDRGIAEISIDGKSAARIDTFVPEEFANSDSGDTTVLTHLAHDVPFDLPTILWGTHSLPDGEHTLELTVTGKKNAQSTGTFIGIDEVVVDGISVTGFKSI